MKTALATLFALGLGVSAAAACPMHTAGHKDTMTTASIDKEKAPMSKPADKLAGSADEATMTGDAADDTVVKEDAAD